MNNAESQPQRLDSEQAVRQRYSAAAQAREAALCCPVDYDAALLKVIPQEVLDRDYGCGDPSRYVRQGDTVLDLGSGGGKICFIASQVVGSTGRVIGVDLNDEMLALARGAAPEVADRLGYANVEFCRGRIQDLGLSLESLDEWLAEHPVASSADLAGLQLCQDRLRAEQPMIADESIDIVVSNCVLNLVSEGEKQQLLTEIFRVLRRGGRIAISDIVCDEDIPDTMRADPELWSGCISGAFHERDILARLAEIGFYGITMDKWEEQPFAVVDGIEFRSVTITATKGKEGECYEANQAVIYRGPWSCVKDDDGHTLERGVRSAVCAKTFDILTQEPYAADIIAVQPRHPIPESKRQLFDCTRNHPRHPRESKGLDYDETRAPSDSESGCC